MRWHRYPDGDAAAEACAEGSGGANGGFSPLYQIGGPRSAQVALKFLF